MKRTATHRLGTYGGGQLPDEEEKNKQQELNKKELVKVRDILDCVEGIVAEARTHLLKTNLFSNNNPRSDYLIHLEGAVWTAMDRTRAILEREASND